MKVRVIGIKWFEDAIDGKDIDSGSLFTECKLDDRRNSKRSGAKGIFSETWRMPSAELIRRVQHIPLPFDAELVVERMGNGKAAREVVTDIRPIEAVLPPPLSAKPTLAPGAAAPLRQA